ncbi:MAG: glycosyltransferase family 4 protein [Oligoflexia bacterium]|nr:glycosyltransferase family 4 protein [Oligoflexia bacterium]
MFRILATSFDYRPRLGGVATLAHELLRALGGSHGVEVRLIAPRLPGGEGFDRGSGVATRRVPLPKAALAPVPLAASLGRELLTWRPDALLNLLWLPEGVASLLLAPLRAPLGIPYFVYGHGVELLESDLNLKKRVRSALSPAKRAVFRGARGVFVNSGFTRALVIRECRVPEARVRIAHPGVDPRAFFPEAPARDLLERYELRGKRVFLMVTRLEDYKGVDRAISALRWLKADFPEARLLVCGEGPDRARLESIARHYGVGELVVFAGAVPAGRLRDHYNLAEAFLLLSRSNFEAPNIEGFGIVFVEAAACGKPSIGGDSGGIPDAIGGPENGWLVDPYDDRAVAKAMREVLERPEEARARGEAARARATGELTWDRMAATLLETMRAGRSRGEA